MSIDLNQVHTLLFDLDGTLLPLDLEEFLGSYLRRLQQKASPYLPPEQFISCLWAATGAMVDNEDPRMENRAVFWQHFCQLSRIPREALEPVFEEFYRQEFPSLAALAKPSPLSREIVGLALEKGKQVVLATNPIFPAIAIWERMRWANLHDLPWRLVTTYENSHYCKPKLAYYREILQQLGRSPEECLMIGNDVQEDLVASQLGIHTYLVTDCLLDKGKPSYSPTLQGDLASLRDWLRRQR